MIELLPAPKVEALIAMLRDARDEMEIATAIQGRLAGAGVVLAEGPHGTTWRRARGD